MHILLVSLVGLLCGIISNTILYLIGYTLLKFYEKNTNHDIHTCVFAGYVFLFFIAGTFGLCYIVGSLICGFFS